MPPINPVGRYLVREGKVYGKITGLVTDIGLCSLHPDCLGPTIRVKWVDRVHERKECLYQLLRGEGYEMKLPTGGE